jgi:N-acetylated-alpha-linked acidic dipeptidase
MGFNRATNAAFTDVPVGDLGSGSDYTVFLQHLGVPATDIGSNGPYGVYHSAFDNYNWFTKFADPTFVYEQEMARIYGLEVIRMGDADILPFDYQEYAREIAVYIESAKRKAQDKFAVQSPNFADVEAAAKSLEAAATNIAEQQKGPNPNVEDINARLMLAERMLLLPEGLPNRPWFKHAIYAPGVYTGYAAVVIPGVNEAIDAGDRARTEQQLTALAAALRRAVTVLYGRPGFPGGGH